MYMFRTHLLRIIKINYHYLCLHCQRSIHDCSKTSNHVQVRDMSSTDSAIDEVEDVDMDVWSHTPGLNKERNV